MDVNLLFRKYKIQIFFNLANCKLDFYIQLSFFLSGRYVRQTVTQKISHKKTTFVYYD